MRLFPVLALAACILANGLTGCAYVEYRRKYELSAPVPEAERGPLSDALERFFAQRGLVLKEKYHDLYPRDVLVSAFEIPRTREEDRRSPLLFVTTSNSGLVQFIQSEWYFRREPEDLVSEAKPELLKAIAATIRAEPDLVLVAVDPAARSP